MFNPFVKAVVIFTAMVLTPVLGFADNFTAYVERGDAFYRNFDNQGALREYQSAYLAAPNDFQVLTRMIRIYNDMGRLEMYKNGGGESENRKAVEYAETLQKLYPDRAETYFWLALAKGSMARFLGISEKAKVGKSVEEYAQKAIELDPNYSHAYMILGIFYRMAGDLSWFEKTVARAVFGTDFQGTYDQSVEMLQKSLALDPDNIYAYYELGRTFDAMERDGDALKAYHTVLSMSPHCLREQRLQEEVDGLLKKDSAQG
jgi:tetratricopeptide (TPR) repeat protein